MHSQSKSNGSVAQLNRVLDYGSSGSRFESWRSHKGGNRKITAAFFMYLSILHTNIYSWHSVWAECGVLYIGLGELKWMGSLENLGSLRSRVVSMDYVLLKFPYLLRCLLCFHARGGWGIKQKKRKDNLPFWCPGRDSNSHGLAPTTPSKWRVYQFHHLGNSLIASAKVVTIFYSANFIATFFNKF